MDQATKSVLYVLKSAIQKAVRRGEVASTIILTKYALELDPHEIIRRLPIIILEDSVVNTGFVKMVENVKLAKKWNYDATQLPELLGTMALAAKGNVRDKAFFGQRAANVDLREVPEPGKAICQAILDRGTWGGMEFDKYLCRFRAQEYKERFEAETQVIPEVVPVEVPVRPLEQLDINPNAIDGHCSGLLNYLSNHKELGLVISSQFDSDRSVVVKELVWATRAGVNTKALIDTGTPLDWRAYLTSQELLPKGDLATSLDVVLPLFHKVADYYAAEKIRGIVDILPHLLENKLRAGPVKPEKRDQQLTLL